MSFQGKSPAVKRVRFTPQSADPVNPAEGDIYYSDGTPRPEGLYSYQNGGWQVLVKDNDVLTALSMQHLTLLPQSADPSSPATGELYYSDGTAREAGVWYYDGSGWAQLSRFRATEFYFNRSKQITTVSTANISLTNSPLYNGQTSSAWGSVTVSTGQSVLLKDQTNPAENGVWIVASGPNQTLSRDTDYDTVDEINKGSVEITQGPSALSVFVQNNTITSVGGSAQSWSTTIAAKTWTVPNGVTELQVWAAGAGSGGGGSSSAGSTLNSGAGGGGGGAGVEPRHFFLKVTPGLTLTINLGKGGLGGAGSGATATAGTSGSSGGVGGNTTVTGASITVSVLGASTVGAPSVRVNGAPSTAGAGASGVFQLVEQTAAGGTGGQGGASLSANGVAGSRTLMRSATSSGGTRTVSGVASGGGGGGGGTGVESGGNGGNGSVTGNALGTRGQPGGISAGGGGGGGAANDAGGSAVAGFAGGSGGHGYVRIVW